MGGIHITGTSWNHGTAHIRIWRLTILSTMLTHTLPTQLTVGISIVFIVVIGQFKPGHTDNAELCKNVRCSSPPKGAVCSETNRTSSKIDKKLGPLKNCCPVFYCKNESQDPFLFIGVNDKRNASKTTSFESSATCDNISCPQDTPGSSCSVETNPENAIMEFAKGKTTCCHVKSCRSSDGLTRTSFSIVHGKLPPLDQLNEFANRCDEFSCPTKPNTKDTTCSVQLAEMGIVIADPLGKLKNCCPIWQCTYADGVVYYHFSIQGTSFRYREILKAATLLTESGSTGAISSGSSKSASTSADENTKTAGGSETASNSFSENHKQFQCAAGESCPKLKKEGCTYSFSGEYDKFVPSEDKCCPLMHCTDENGVEKTHYVKYSGNIPTDEYEIEKEKGKSGKSKKCPKISCTEQPKMSNLMDCTSEPMGFAPIIPKIKPFTSCCSAWRCSREDGSYSLQLGITGFSFSYVEISFHDIQLGNLDTLGGGHKPAVSIGKTKSSKKVSSKSYSESNAGENQWMTMGKWVPQSLTGLQNFAFQQANQNSLMNPVMNQQVPFLPQPMFGG